MPRVTVVIPTYNRASSLQRALHSVFAQTYGDVEVVVADDGSTDNTAEVCRSYPRLRYIRNDHSGLPAVPRNRALAVSSGDYVAFLDSDDQWMPHKLAAQVDLMDSNPALGLVCSNAMVANEADVTGELYLPFAQGKSGRILHSLLRDNFVVTSTALLRRSLLDSVGHFSEEKAMRGVEDYELWLRIAARSELAFVPAALAIYQRSAVSHSRSQGNVQHWTSLLWMLARIKTSHRTDGATLKVIHDRETACRSTLCDTLALDRQYLKLGQALLEFSANDPGAALRYVRISAAKVYRRQQEPRAARSDRNSLRLHLGCGDRYLDGYVNIDFPPSAHTVQSGKTPDLHADITTLKYPDGSVDEVRLHHVFEHFDRSTAIRLLIEWHLWLREGGKLIIETPDLAASLPALSSLDSPGTQFRTLRHIFGSHEAEWAIHKDGWYAQKFRIHLEELGYEILSIDPTSWQGIHNVTVTAAKSAGAKSMEDLLKSARKLLALSLVDNSETELRLLDVWMGQIHSGLSRDT